ncbi:DUF6773 family protein [Bacillus toyonensis]|uniref:DUF6773 family protein n=1 Tax=Bacillus toyonensis TaxID=155322 RepID=UPI00211D90E6|nr:DUF6773 family protein [Bacillus toyonensis]
MEKFKNLFSLSTHSDERIQQIEMKIWAQSGIVVLLLAIIDLIIRGVYLQRLFLEWATALGIIICYMVFFFIRSILAGVYALEIDNKEKLKQKLKAKLSYTLILSFSGVAYTTYHNQLPQDIVGWIFVCIKFILLVTILFGIQYFITILARNKFPTGWTCL